MTSSTVREDLKSWHVMPAGKIMSQERQEWLFKLTRGHGKRSYLSEMLWAKVRSGALSEALKSREVRE